MTAFADLAASLLSPTVLCFALGLLAALLRSDLEFPPPFTKALSLLLLFALGLKGGLALGHAEFTAQLGLTLFAAVGAALAVPLWVFAVLCRRLGPVDAAALAATYGSVSAVTFVTATHYLTQRGVGYSGHMVAALALMESPAIVLGVYLARRYTPTAAGGAGPAWRQLGRDALCNGSVLLLLGSLAIGWLCGAERSAPLKSFVDLVFPGALALFLLELGLVAGRSWGHVRQLAGSAVAFALLAPLVNGSLGLALAAALRLPHGDALLLVVLCASASYIAVPAALRHALPNAHAGLYVTLSLAVTFPLNLTLGIPLYDRAVAALPHL